MDMGRLHCVMTDPGGCDALIDTILCHQLMARGSGWVRFLGEFGVLGKGNSHSHDVRPAGPLVLCYHDTISLPVPTYSIMVMF